MAIETIGIKDTSGVTRQVYADQVGSAFAQVFKAAFGADGVLTPVEAANPLPVTLPDVSGLATQTTLAALRDRLPAALVLGALGVTESGAYDYRSGTAAAIVDVPAGARVKRVSVLAGDSGSVTVAIAGGATITIPAGGSFDEQIPGLALAGGDVVIGGTVATYYVSWVT